MARSEQGTHPRSETRLAPVYVNNRKVPIEARNPTVAEVMRKAGYDPERHDAFLLRDAKDTRGEPIRMQKILHLDGRHEPLYLRCVPKATPEKPPSVVPTLTSQPEADPRRSITITDLNEPVPPVPGPGPEPPGPPGLG